MKCSRLHRRDRTDGRNLRSARVRTLSQGRLLYTVTFALASLPARRSGRCRALTFISAVLAVVLGPEHLAHPCEEVLSQRLRLFRRQDLIRALDVERFRRDVGEEARRLPGDELAAPPPRAAEREREPVPRPGDPGVEEPSLLGEGVGPVDPLRVRRVLQ